MNAKIRHRRRYRAAHAKPCPGVLRNQAEDRRRHEYLIQRFRDGEFGATGQALAKAFEEEAHG